MLGKGPGVFGGYEIPAPFGRCSIRIGSAKEGGTIMAGPPFLDCFAQDQADIGLENVMYNNMALNQSGHCALQPSLQKTGTCCAPPLLRHVIVMSMPLIPVKVLTETLSGRTPGNRAMRDLGSLCTTVAKGARPTSLTTCLN
eukprot:7307949-Ditylum_brightwellii.AAC.1